MISNSQFDDTNAPSRKAGARRPSHFKIDIMGFEPMGVVCAALALAWIALACRIASIW